MEPETTLVPRDQASLVNLPATQNGGYDLTAIGLKLTDPDLPFEEFSDLCWVLGRMHEAVRFAIGDAIRLGEELYGEEVHQALELLNLSEAGRLEYVRVATRVPRSRRRRDLSWSHHRAVASLDPVAQKTWLKRCSDEGMSHHQLRDALRGSGAGSPEPGPATCQCCGRTL